MNKYINQYVYLNMLVYRYKLQCGSFMKSHVMDVWASSPH